MNEVLPGAFADTWMGMVAPPGTPAEITKKISDAIGAGMKDKETSDRIKGLMADPIASSPAQMRDLIRQSAEQWSPVITTAKITVE